MNLSRPVRRLRVARALTARARRTDVYIYIYIYKKHIYIYDEVFPHCTISVGLAPLADYYLILFLLQLVPSSPRVVRSMLRWRRWMVVVFLVVTPAARKRIFGIDIARNFSIFRTGPVDKASRGDSLELNDSTNSDDDREQLSTRALYQTKLFGAYENGLFESGTCVFYLY